ncbi:unnamed protein product [Phytophthora fragariaefolia]|uniref:Unnamed protein product n=1 Tax=Phytophthora fragariaefolia TaxID=1490495 RepID=A0A9W6Y7Z9_9STRA|nr:unnamed protein product [Phytophthora fragariaefolia]
MRYFFNTLVALQANGTLQAYMTTVPARSKAWVAPSRRSLDQNYQRLKLDKCLQLNAKTHRDIYDPGISDGAPIIDSVSTYHITGAKDLSFDLRTYEPHAVEIADGGIRCGKEKGKMVINELNGAVLDNVVYAPEFSETLISVKKLIDAGMKDEFTDTECLIYDKPIMRGKVSRCIYRLNIPRAMAASALRPNSIEDWHQRLGHLNYRSIIDLRNSNSVRGLRIVTPSKTCEVCARSKSTRAAAPKKASRPENTQNEVCHGDLSGPFQRSYHGNKYYFALKWRGHTTVYFIKTKDETTTCFKNYMNLVNRCFPKTDGTKVYRSDNGGEFLAIGFCDACAAEGLATEMSEPEAHHQNGVIERTHRTLADTARSLMLQAKLPHYLWEYAVQSAVNTRNRVISRSDPTMTPF